MNKSINDRLEILYNKEDAKKAKVAIDDLVKLYKKRYSSTSYNMTQKDLILITYADQFYDEYSTPSILVLEKFLDSYLHNIINCVHLLPFYPYSSDDGFSVIDYKAVAKNVGEWRDIERLSTKFRLMFDGVINHISKHSNWFKEFLAQNDEYEDFFVEVDKNQDLSKVVRPRTLPLLHPFKFADNHEGYIWTTFSQDQVDLNYKNYRVLIDVLDVLLFYIQKGAKLLRLDAIAFLWKEIGTNSIHLPQTHEVIQLMRDVLHQVAPEVIIITETNVPHDENISYFGNGNDEAQMVYNFALPPLIAHSILVGDATVMQKWAKELTLPSDKVCFFNFTASHDGCGMRPVSELLSNKEIDNLVKSVEKRGGYVSYRSLENGEKSPYELNASYIDIVSDPNEDLEIRVKKMILSQAVVLAMPGVAGIYIHSIIGSSSDRDSVKKSGVYRSINREKLNIETLSKELNTPNSLRGMIFDKYRVLLNLRRKYQAFNPYSSFEILDIHPSLFVIKRNSHGDDNNILAIHNFSNMPIVFKLPSFIRDNSFDLINNQIIDSREFKIGAYGIIWIKQNKTKDDL